MRGKNEREIRIQQAIFQDQSVLSLSPKVQSGWEFKIQSTAAKLTPGNGKTLNSLRLNIRVNVFHSFKWSIALFFSLIFFLDSIAVNERRVNNAEGISALSTISLINSIEWSEVHAFWGYVFPEWNGIGSAMKWGKKAHTHTQTNIDITKYLASEVEYDFESSFS